MTTKQRENKHGQGSPWWGQNGGGGFDFIGAEATLVAGLGKDAKGKR
jgi:hypothetical protein